MSLVSLSWTLSRFPGPWDAFYLDCILSERDPLFKFSGKFRYLGIEDLPQEFLIENSSVKVEFLENKKGKITAGAYLLSQKSYMVFSNLGLALSL